MSACAKTDDSALVCGIVVVVDVVVLVVDEVVLLDDVVGEDVGANVVVVVPVEALVAAEVSWVDDEPEPHAASISAPAASTTEPRADFRPMTDLPIVDMGQEVGRELVPYLGHKVPVG